MSDLKNAVISLVFSTIAICLCELLIPKDNYKNQVRLITGCVLIICMITPFFNGFNFEELHFYNKNEVNINEKLEKSVAYAVKNEISQILDEHDIHTATIKIITDFDENNSIIVESVIILFDNKDKSKSEYISNIVENKLGFKVEVGERING